MRKEDLKLFPFTNDILCNKGLQISIQNFCYRKQLGKIERSPHLE